MSEASIENPDGKQGQQQIFEPRSFMRFICHQRPERCFKYKGKTMPICARCFGFYLGFSIGFIIPALLWFIYDLEILLLGYLLLICATPMAIDGITQLFGKRQSNNNLRFTTGIIAGFALGLVFNWLLVHLLIIDR